MIDFVHHRVTTRTHSVALYIRVKMQRISLSMRRAEHHDPLTREEPGTTIYLTQILNPRASRHNQSDKNTHPHEAVVTPNQTQPLTISSKSSQPIRFKRSPPRASRHNQSDLSNHHLEPVGATIQIQALTCQAPVGTTNQYQSLTCHEPVIIIFMAEDALLSPRLSDVGKVPVPFLKRQICQLHSNMKAFIFILKLMLQLKSYQVQICLLFGDLTKVYLVSVVWKKGILKDQILLSCVFPTLRSKHYESSIYVRCHEIMWPLYLKVVQFFLSIYVIFYVTCINIFFNSHYFKKDNNKNESIYHFQHICRINLTSKPVVHPDY